MEKSIATANKTRSDIAMQRHMDLILKILDQTERRTEREPKPIDSAEIRDHFSGKNTVIGAINGYSDLVVGQHVELLFDAGYLVGNPYEGTDYKHVEIRDLTWDGHEFLAVLRNDHGWGKVKKSFSAAELAKMPIKMIEALATAALKQWVFQHMGLPGG